MTPTLWTLFVPEESDARVMARRIGRSPELEALRDELAGEVDATFWTSAPLAIVDGLRQMMDVPVGEILCRAWTTHPGLLRQLETSIVPERLVLFDLGEHEIRSRHHPSIDVRALSRRLGSLAFDLALSLQLQVGRLQLQDGRLMRATLGACWGSGALRLGSADLAVLDSHELELPSPLGFGDGVPLRH